MKVGDIIVHLGYGECELIRQMTNNVFDAIMIRRPDKEIKIWNIKAAILREKYLSIGDMVHSLRLGNGIVISVPDFKEDEYRVDFLNGLENEKCVIGEFEENTIRLCKKAIVPFIEGDIIYDKVREKCGIIRGVMSQEHDRFYRIEFNVGDHRVVYENLATLTLEKIVTDREIDIFSLDGIIL